LLKGCHSGRHLSSLPPAELTTSESNTRTPLGQTSGECSDNAELGRNACSAAKEVLHKGKRICAASLLMPQVRTAHTTEMGGGAPTPHYKGIS